MKHIILQSVLTLAAFLIVFLWQLTPLADYTVPVLGVFIFIYLVISMVQRKRSIMPDNDNPWSIFALTTVVLFIVTSNGGINSTLFFLLYFLAFGLALVFEPPVVFVFMIAAFFFFLPDALLGDVGGRFLRLGSLILICPIAFFFGRSFRKEEQQDQYIDRTRETVSEIQADAQKLLIEQRKKLKRNEVEKINDILEKTESLQNTK